MRQILGWIADAVLFGGLLINAPIYAHFTPSLVPIT